MCNNENCPHKEKCYRYTAPKGEFQYYGTHLLKEDNTCEDFWPNDGHMKGMEFLKIIGKLSRTKEYLQILNQTIF